MDVAAARRGWTAALGRIRKSKPSRAALFENTAVEVDHEGYLRIVFPESNAFGRQAAETGDGRALIAEALAAVFLRDVPFMIASGSVGAACPVPAASVAADRELAAAPAPEAVPAPAAAPASVPALEPVAEAPAPAVGTDSPADPVEAAFLAAFGEPAQIIEEAPAVVEEVEAAPAPEEINGSLLD